MYKLFLLFALFLTSSVSASTTNVNVETHVESSNTSVVNVDTSSTTHKKVEIDVNGEKHVYESDKPGDQTIRVESIDGKTTINTTGTTDEQLSPEPSITSSPKLTPPPAGGPTPDLFKDVPQTSIAEYIIDSIKEFLSNLF